MNQLLRHRLPPSVRSLLTDIGPKEDSHCSEWTESEPEPKTVRHGIVLPSRGTAHSEEFLTPADAQTDDASTGDGKITNHARVCGLCKSKPSCYTCPRCNVAYCGLACYRSPEHTVCSEEFYKQAVLQELKDMGQTEAEGRQKMQDILLGLKKRADQTDGGMESVLREVGIGSDEEDDIDDNGEMKEKAQVLELLSRLAELQQAGEGRVEEIESILRKLKEIGARGEEDVGDRMEEEAEYGEEEEPDLADRLSGLDVDALSEEALWECLSTQEKGRFLDLIKGGACGKLVPPWRPWWETHEDEGRALVELLEEEEEEEEEEVSVLEVGESVTGGVNSGETKEQKGISQMKDETSRPVQPLAGKQENGNTVSKSAETALVEGKLATRRNTRQVTDKQICQGGKGTTPAVSSVPPVSGKIPKLSSLSPNPSPLVCYGLVNALFGYTFTLTLFNGDTESLNSEFCDTVLAVSEALSTSRVFHSVQEALQCGKDAIQAGGYFDVEDPHATTRAVGAVAHVVTGRNRRDAAGYCLAALSQLRSALSQARAALPKGGVGGEGRRKHFLAGKKCEFFQAWVLDNDQQMRRLAIGLWKEHSERCAQRDTLEKDKKVVESWKKAKRRGNDILIVELN